MGRTLLSAAFDFGFDLLSESTRARRQNHNQLQKRRTSLTHTIYMVLILM